MDSRNVTNNLFLDSDIYVTGTKLGEIAAKIAYYNYEYRYSTIVLFNWMHLVALKVFLTNYNKGIVLKKGKYLSPRRSERPHVPQFVIFGQDSGEISDMVQWLIEYKYDNTARYIIVCTSNDELMCDNESLFHTLSEIFIANVVFLKESNDKIEQVTAFTFYPVLPQKCWNKEPKKLDMVYNCVNETCFKSLFPDKFKNLYQCPLIISTFEQPPYMLLHNSTGTIEINGGDAEILKLVVSMMNASLVIKTPSDGTDWGHYENNNWTGSLGDVYNGHAQASMCSTPLSIYKYGNFQTSFTYDSMDMVWAARLPALKPSWEKLLYPLATNMRITLLFMFIAIVFINTFIKTKVWRNIRIAIDIPPPKSNLLFYSWILFLGMPLLRMPTKLSLRILVSTWIWFCLIIRTVYQGALIGSLKLQAYESNMNTFQEVLANKYPFGGLPLLREYYSEDPKVYNNWKLVTLDKAPATLDEMSDGRSDFVIAMNRETIIEYLLKSNGTKKLQIIPEKVVNSPNVIYFKKYSHLTYPTSHYLSIILEAGFTQQLYARYLNHIKRLFQQSNTRIPGPLNLKHFIGCIIVLIVGWLLSILFFVVEVFCGRHAKILATLRT